MPKTNIKVKLIGNDGNAFFILGSVLRAMRKAGLPQDTITEYTDKAKSGDYDNLLRVTSEYVDIY